MGLYCMMERHKNNNERYKSASIDNLRSILCDLKEHVDTNKDHGISCDVVDQSLIMFDEFPVQLFYNDDVKHIIDLLRDKYHECYEALQDLHKYVSDSIVESLQQQGQDDKMLRIHLCLLLVAHRSKMVCCTFCYKNSNRHPALSIHARLSMDLMHVHQ
mmetsp:Transcript_49902/g.55650  ORF Transcript_49902/g.55650 Transcript_49902/m.55650 type:complete len:159 (-) Transcript_49902:2978-3454(-)